MFLLLNVKSSKRLELCPSKDFCRNKYPSNLYYSLIYPYFTYGIVNWEITCHHTINPLYILQKKAIRILTFADFNVNTNLIFVDLKILKFHIVWF